jgi:SWI/SNF-related matrix-associated actin-dependent regulator 1 of chromatin subfamily A
MLDLLQKNREMLAAKAYKLADERTMLKISSLSNPNDYDLYLVACCLCNYPIEEKSEARELRTQYFKATNNGSIIGFEHPVTDYKKTVTSVECKNTDKVNKFGLYEYEININDKNLVSDLWEAKAKNCLKYVDNKTFADKLIVSISRDQLDNFTKLLDRLMIKYDEDDIEAGLFYQNKSSNQLVDLSTLSLPFTPYYFQLEDAAKIIKKKRVLLGHDMGCFTGNTKVQIADNEFVEIKDLVSIGMFTTISYNINSKRYDINKAIVKKTRTNAELVLVKYHDEVGTVYNIYCTPDHKFLTNDIWMCAKDLVPNMKLTSNNHIIIVDSIKNTNKREDVYCLTVDNNHNFLINGGVVVHNCGKTLISVLVGSSLFNMPKLVVCPASLRLNWYREITTVCPDADVQIQLNAEAPHFGKDWTIIGYGSVAKFLDDLKKYFNCIFVDECHACKSVNNWGNPTSKRAKSVLELADAVEYCYPLTGTPLPSHNIDLYNILKMLKCEAFDFNNKWAFLNFANKFCDPKETYFGKDFSGNSNSDQLHALLSNIMVRRLKKDVLPNLKKQRQFIPLDPHFKREYMNIEKRLYEPENGDTYMGLAMTGRKMLSIYKLDAAIELAETLLDAGESVVIVTNFVDSADLLKDHFKDNCCEIRGGMSDQSKQQAIDDFQNKKKTVCVLNMQAGGVGITLTAAHTMIIIDYAWVPSDMVQVEDRICRTGQTENCMIYYVYCMNSILDSLFIEMISSKSANIDTVVDNVDNTFDLQSEKDTHFTFIDALKDRISSAKKANRKKRTGGT